LTPAYHILIFFVISFILAGCGGKRSAENSELADTTLIELTPQEFKSRLASTPDAVLVDVRKPEELSDGMIDGAINIDYKDSSFTDRIQTLDKTKTYFLYCKSGIRSSDAARDMQKLGFENLYVLEGGHIEWLKSNSRTN
jgi:rhodanese-related sulfurtransferase